MALSRCRSLEGLVLKKKLFPDSFFTDTLVSDFYKGVDNAAHIQRLAKAVNYVAFEWEKNAGQKVEGSTGESSEHTLPAGYKDAFDTAHFQVYLYHETESELDHDLWDVISSIVRNSGLNVYYRMKLHKEIKAEIADLRSRGLLL